MRLLLDDGLTATARKARAFAEALRKVSVGAALHLVVDISDIAFALHTR
jgi:hypothetical protein